MAVPPQLPKASIARIEAVRAEAMSLLRAELIEHWRVTCRSVETWRKRNPNSVVEPFPIGDRPLMENVPVCPERLPPRKV